MAAGKVIDSSFGQSFGSIIAIRIDVAHPSVIPSGHDGNHEHEYDYCHREQAQETLNRVPVQVTSQERQAREVCERGEPGQVDNGLPVISGYATFHIGKSADQNRKAGDRLAITHCNYTLNKPVRCCTLS